MIVTLTIIITVLFFLFFLLVRSIYQPVGNIVFNQSQAKNINAQASQLEKHVTALCSTTGYRNYQNKVAQAEALGYISNSLKEFGYETHEQKFEAVGEEYVNIIAFYGNPNAPRIVIGAHYDSFGDQHGADDNASGIAGVLEIARLLQEHQPALNYCIELVAYANEERPFFTTKDMGSYVHAAHNFDKKVDTKLMICLEMIGYFDETDGSQSYPIKGLDLLYPKAADFIALVGDMNNHATVKKFKTLMKEVCNTSVYSINAPSSVKGLSNSDHRNYWHFKQNALMITDTSFFRNPHYHQKSDLPETLNFEKMAEILKGSYNAIVNITL
ncbi:M28 family peptidase [Flammeovirga yaeyamensis]|uniref:M28 family peptidase n=1 Tax=Flammeovirga yaeyamensis TaxID=367791 RepID=A0AAX1N6B7_9BACT|nr:M28 family peptidase [Flammeovirga yaeyamensis]MBB3697675.1 hypothetical protein [Flammeovirga yaeyamensis]NMF35965.1 M28 family peptidase [Flammeovirga yaeyamensis]QWG03088.1 M28 family peptidase [Flammeovirga yaeyamensis]